MTVMAHQQGYLEQFVQFVQGSRLQVARPSCKDSNGPLDAIHGPLKRRHLTNQAKAIALDEIDFTSSLGFLVNQHYVSAMKPVIPQPWVTLTRILVRVTRKYLRCVPQSKICMTP